jgi:TPR repeat protein
MQIDFPLSAKERSDRLEQIPKLKELSADGDVAAQIKLAWELAEGKIIDADFGEADRLFRRAAASGDQIAKMDAARFLQLRRVPSGTRAIKEFALKGNTKAQFWLAGHYQQRAGRINRLRALAWLKRAAINGSTAAHFTFLGQQIRLAPIYLKPILVIKVIIQLCYSLFDSSSDIDFEVTENHLLTRLKQR